MEVRPVQFNINTKSTQPSEKKEVKPYLEAEGTITTDNLVKPLPGKGHLIHDTILTGPRYFIKDIGYDMKSVKNSFEGKVSDHQSGRLNDVGLKLGGIGIATYLASQTSDPKARIMEYIGLGAFLTAMNIYPKIAINKPAEWMHGHDIDKWYIDDQGRKKSVNQDSNYVPYDLYRGEAKGEDLDEIGDRMGIPRDLKNRHEIIKEQMRKIAIQSNTLWMLTAGLATPAMTALACCGLEKYVVEPFIAKTQNAEFNQKIANTLAKTQNMTLEVGELQENLLSQRVEKVLKQYQNKELPQEEFEQVVELLTEHMDNTASTGIRKDLTNIFKTAANGKESVIIDSEAVDRMIDVAKNSISRDKKALLEPILVPSAEEITEAIHRAVPSLDVKEGAVASVDDLPIIKEELKKVIDAKIEASSGIPKEALQSRRNTILENISKSVQVNKSFRVSDDAVKKVVDFAKVLGEFKENQNALDKCKSFKFEFRPGSVIANSYSKFEKTLLKELGISYKDMAKMRESDSYTKEILDTKLSELCKDDSRYKKVMEKLGKVMSEMEVNLNGANDTDSHIKDLISATENNYNNTAKHLAKLQGFDTTIQKLVNEDVETLSNSISSKENLFDFLDGLIEAEHKDFHFQYGTQDPTQLDLHKQYAKYSYKGLGSSKNQEITRMAERYQGAKNSFNRILHTFEIYKRAENPAEFVSSLMGATEPEMAQKLANEAKEMLLNASASDHNLKLNLVNNPRFYQDLMNTTYQTEAGAVGATKEKGFVTDIAKEALGKENGIAKGNVLERYQYYIARFKNLVSNGTIDFTKPEHHLDQTTRDAYTQASKTRMSFFNLIGQTPVDMIKGAADRKYTTQRWVRIVGGVTAAVFAGTILAQIGFGKIRNPHNLKKQVQNETN
jgi:hypothetical protein